jgi:hypothetical protein
MIRIRFDGCDLSRPCGTPVNRVYPYDRGVARYDGIADWYDTDFLGDVHDPGREAAIRLLGEGRYGLEAPGVGTEGLRAKVGAVHLTLGCFLQMFLDAGLRLEHFEELENRPYPFAIALRWRR